MLATDTKRVVTSSHLYYYSHTSGHLTVSRTFLCQVFNPWNLASTLSLHVIHQIENLSKRKMFCSTVIALQLSPVVGVFEACCYSTRKIDHWRNDAVSCTKRSSRPFPKQNLWEHSGSDILGSLQKKLERINATSLYAYFEGEGLPVRVTMATKPLQLLQKLQKNYKTFTFFFYLLLIFKDSPTGKGTLVEGVSVGRWNYMFP